MKLIIPNHRTLDKQYISATPLMTVAEVLQIVKEEEGTLRYRNRVLGYGDTLRESGLITRHKLLLFPPKTRTLPEKTKRAQGPCMISLDDGEERAEMSCGHAIAPRSLFKLCRSEFSTGKVEIRCPYVSDDLTGCRQVWEMDELVEKACLDRSEHAEFMAFVNETLINLRKVKENLSTSQELARILNECDWKEVGGVKSPSHRACPKCGAVIEHISGCNQMTCQFPGCNTTFCFVCLGMLCRGNCYLAPVQIQFDYESDSDCEKTSQEDNKSSDVSEKQIEFVRKLSKALSQIYSQTTKPESMDTMAENMPLVETTA
ncbi:hypothetical protein ScPMuIL_007747 [Solemya velum]